MRIPNPAIRLPAWAWLDSFDVWRCKHGILTGRWTQQEVDDINRRAHQDWLRLRGKFE